jgi:hypothetical protein
LIPDLDVKREDDRSIVRLVEVSGCDRDYDDRHDRGYRDEVFRSPSDIGSPSVIIGQTQPI